MRIQTILTLFALMIFLTSTLLAETTQSIRREEVATFVKNAVAYIQKVGKDKALKEFNKPDGQFHKGDLYIYGYYYRGPQKNICVAHGLYPDWVGKDKTDYIDPITKARIIPLFSQTAQKGGGWVIYHFEDPETHKIRTKHGYEYPVPGEDFFLGSGYYSDVFEP